MPDLRHLTTRALDAEQDGSAASSEFPTQQERPGISAFVVKLASLRRDILRYTLPYHPRNKGHVPSAMPWSDESPFTVYEDSLEKWRQCLPDELQFKAEVMYTRRFQLVSFVTLQCLFHGCYCDLYRIGSYITASQSTGALDARDFPLPLSFLSTCRQGRLQHAFAICKVISDSMEHHKSGHDPVVGISAALAIRVLVIERQQEDSVALGLTDEMVYTCLDAAVQCAKEISRCSVPIRDLVRRFICFCQWPLTC